MELIHLMLKANALHEAALLAYHMPLEKYRQDDLARVLADFDVARAAYAAAMEATK